MFAVGCAGNHGAAGGDDDGSGSDIPANCGNGMIDGNEQCDDGNTADGDGCSHTCTLEGNQQPSCGDGIVETGEGCDDGNTVSGDGCSSHCQPESTGLPCTPHSFRCGPSGDVETCNNAGTAWQFVETCDLGCNSGACTDPTCEAGAKRCHGETVETCNASGTGWDAGETCTTYCASGACALDGLNVNQNSNYDGAIIVAGDFTVGNGSTLTSTSGDLTIIADNITVDTGAAIAVAPTGMNLQGSTCYINGYYYYSANYGGGATGSYVRGVWGSDTDANADQGSPGQLAGTYGCTGTMTAPQSLGGGRLRLIAKNKVTIAGQVLAPGGAWTNSGAYYLSGGSGGGIQIAGDTIVVSGSISTAGGGGSSYGMAGYGRVRLLYGHTLTTTGATIIGNVTQGRRPPLDLTSSTQPNPSLVYNDGFDTFSLAFERAFGDAQGYLHTVSQSEFAPPSSAAGIFSSAEAFDVPSDAFKQGNNWVHIASLDANSTLGTVESRFEVQVNTLAPTLSSSTHPSSGVWYANANPYFQWTMPGNLADGNFKRVHYVFDQYMDTLPTVADTSLVASQHQLLIPNVTQGIWALHVITEDQMGHLTKVAAHTMVRVGTDPGTGTVFGTVFDENNHPVNGATVRVNRGFFTSATNSSGSYTIPNVSAGTWEISVVYPDHHANAQQLTVTTGQQSSANFTLAHN